ncbi:MAG: BatA and WFA domain-containing protein, partial [Verrucomicrobiota bacterium]|nr:BatA and WFA domain-containing protein [Verrucomicrobiota bacterium]
MSFSALSAAWLFLLLVPLIVFYFLKLKRPRLEIPSLVLWRQVLADQRVNSPFQKFKRNLLLLLQILLLALLVLAAMQPFLRREAARAERRPILIDVSASMAALDREGGATRLAEVKKRVRDLIDGLPADQELSLVAFSKNARRLTPFTNNARDLRTALDTLEVEDLPSDLEEALRMAQALARTAAFDQVLLFSDGNFPARANFELPFKIDYQRVAPAGSNYGITACAGRRAAGGRWEVFVQLGVSAEAEPSTGTVELEQDGAVVATESVPLTKGASPRLAFALARDELTMVHARLKLGGFDALAADNDAWLALPAARPLAVYLAPKLGSYRQAFATIDGLALFPREGEALPASFDLVVTDNAADLELPAPVHCTIGLVPADLQKLVSFESGNSRTIDWRRDAPLLQHVALDDVIFMDSPVNAPGIDDASYANLGYEILARGPRGPLILARRTGGALSVALLFHTDRSTLPYRVGFPILCSNLVQLAMQQSGLSEAQAARTGVLPPVTLSPNGTYRIEGPNNLRREQGADDRGQLTGLPAPRAGE